MSPVLATVMMSLALPAVALAIIARLEKSEKETQDEHQNPAIGSDVGPSSPAQTADVAERPYSKRAG